MAIDEPVRRVLNVVKLGAHYYYVHETLLIEAVGAGTEAPLCVSCDRDTRKGERPEFSIANGPSSA